MWGLPGVCEGSWGSWRVLSNGHTLASIPAIDEDPCVPFYRVGTWTETEQLLRVTQVGEVHLHPSLGISKPVASPLQVPGE